MLVETEAAAPARFGSTGAVISANSAHANGASKDRAMAHAPTQSVQDPPCEPFLNAPLGEERRGSGDMVLAMRARLDVDRWSEASEFSRLAKAAARQRQEESIERFNDASTPVPDRRTVVSGLLAFPPWPVMSARSLSGGGRSEFVFPARGSPIFCIVAAAMFAGSVAILAQGQ